MRDLERKLLYAAVLLLGIVVGYLAWPTDPRVAPPDPPVTPPDCPVEHADIKSTIDQLATDSASQHAAIRKLVDDLHSHITSTCGTCPSCGTPQRDCPASSVVSNFTLLYENARLNNDEAITAKSGGVRLEERHKQRLEKIAIAFKACQREAGIPVKFGVTGYSSTAKFQRENPARRVGMPNSDELNLKTANLRAEVVADYLREKGFEVERKRWDSFEALDRPYLDDTPADTDKEALNRTVFIEVLHAGACDLRRLPRPTR